LLVVHHLGAERLGQSGTGIMTTYRFYGIRGFSITMSQFFWRIYEVSTSETMDVWHIPLPFHWKVQLLSVLLQKCGNPTRLRQKAAPKTGCERDASRIRRQGNHRQWPVFVEVGHPGTQSPLLAVFHKREVVRSQTSSTIWSTYYYNLLHITYYSRICGIILFWSRLNAFFLQPLINRRCSPKIPPAKS